MTVIIFDYSAELLTYLLIFCRSVIGLTFVVSLLTKVVNRPEFEQTILNFNIIPRRLAKTAALLFLAGEFAVVAFIAVGGEFLWFGFALAILLLLMFCIALTSVLVRRMRTTCNCFGSSEKPISVYDIGRNICFTLCAATGWLTSSILSVSTNLGLIELSLISLIAIAFVTVAIHLDDIVTLFRMA